jgi:intraflagellar transport protein 80
MIDSQNGKLMNTNSIRHTIEVVSLRVNICGGPSDRKCAFIDKNWDLYLSLIRASPLLLIRTIKLTSMVRSIRWCEDNDMLATLSESTGRMVVFTYPHVVFCDRELQTDTMSERETMGKISLIDSFTDSIIRVKRVDGSVIAIGINPLLHLLHNYASGRKWNEALRLCRTTDTLDEHDRESRIMWSTFAGMALSSRQLAHCESAYCEIDRVDKVNYIQRITEIPDAAARNGETCLLMGNVREAEMIFLQSGFNLRAIILNLDLFNWNRALELALKVEQKDGLYVRLVLTQRAAYLNRFNQEEQNKNFSKVADEYEPLDNETIDALKKNPFEKTRVISGSSAVQSASSTRIGSNSSASSSSASSGRGGGRT